ncbi:hypothetical protein AMTR_s00004p00269340, partial [Amborella trichopoda]
IECPVGPLVPEDVLAKTNVSFCHYLENLLETDPRVPKGPSGPFIRDLNKLIEAESADLTSIPIQKSKGKREVMRRLATRQRLAYNLSSQKKRQERSPTPPPDEPAHEPLAKRKSPSPSGDPTAKDPSPWK